MSEGEWETAFLALAVVLTVAKAAWLAYWIWFTKRRARQHAQHAADSAPE